MRASAFASASVDATLPAAALGHRLARRCAAVGLAVTSVLWHLGGTVAVAGDEAALTVVAGAVLTLLPAAWVVWLIRDGGRAPYVAGTALALLTLGASAGLLVAGAPVTPGVAVGLAAQIALLQLAAAGAADLSAGLSAWSTRAGLVAVAVSLSALVAGIGHAHGATPLRPPGGTTTPSYLCHLI
jgi:hypothetical protein